MLLHSITGWQPFKIDALGLVTIFGAEEMNLAVGTLTQSWVTDWLPFLGFYTVANNQIVKPNHGFVLYNITDGIVAIDVCGWVTRWLLSYPITYSATKITLRVDGSPISADRRAIAIGLGMLATLPLLILAILVGDWWAMVNTLAMIISVVARQQITGQLRDSIDQAANNIPSHTRDSVKVFLTLPNGNAVTIYGTRMAIVKILLTDPRPVNRGLYSDMRIIAWLAFGIHAISLGMAALINQICCVSVLVFCSFLKCRQIGDRVYMVGTKLHLETELGDSSWTRSSAYIRLNLTDTEQDNMIHWNLLPQLSNDVWWARYKQKEAAVRTPPNTGGPQSPVTVTSPNPAPPIAQPQAAQASQQPNPQANNP